MRLQPGVKCALLLLSLLACERADKAPPPMPPPPTPKPKPDPVKQARDEFELVSPDLAAGTSRIYWRSDFLPNATVAQQFDQGDFLGRMITLFGPRDDHMWVLRHKQTGEIITAYADDGGPAYGGTSRGAAPAPQLAGVARRLDALVSQVVPADWDMTTYYAGKPTVEHVGAKGGVSFHDELAPEPALAFLLQTAAATDPNYELYQAALEYYATHKAALADQKPRIITAYRRFIALAHKAEPDDRRALLDEARDLEP